MSEEFRGFLTSGEEVIMSDSASIDYGGGKLILTNKRLLFCGAKSRLAVTLQSRERLP